MEKISVSRLSFRRKGSWRHKEKEKKETEEEFDYSSMSYVSQEEVLQIDQELLSEFFFTVDQLTELSGYSCAVTIGKCYPPETLKKDHAAVLVCCGPGNNGGDGLVCARHLKLFGYKPTLYYPKQNNKPFFKSLALQCERLDIPTLSFFPTDPQCIADSFNLVIDAIFGFNFVSPVRPEFVSVVDSLIQIQDKVPICSIDVPSGWDIDKGNTDGLQPTVLISLAVPKLCATFFKGQKHFLGGRFLPLGLVQKYGLRLPAYHGTDPIVELKISENSTNQQS
uniref:NAD(P)H-hydrate epimerase n=1 Tax=Arion vulgaris TaxID=1028688 RepID=A0A0B6ZB71_9EUPU